MVFTAPFRLVLRALEVGQDFFVGPAVVTQGSPVIVIFALTPYIHHSIDGAGAPEYFASWPSHFPAIHISLGIGLVAPVNRLVLHGEGKPQGNVNHGIVIPRTSFQ